MKIEIDKGSGFCFGVVNAIDKAEEALGKECHVFSLGDIVHNRAEVRRLEQMGLSTVGADDLGALGGKTILIRAHGEPPSTYRRAEVIGIEILDATCPVVARLQKRVRNAYEEMRAVNGQVVLLGKRGHAEVVGLAGQADGDVIVIEGLHDLGLIDYSRPVYLLSQTTQSLSLFGEVSAEIRRRAADPGSVIIKDTICRHVANREPNLREFASRFDVIIFVSGRKSSNGKVLCEVCRGANPRTHHVEDETELRREWFEGVESVGICGATSTPAWSMERVAAAIERFDNLTY